MEALSQTRPGTLAPSAVARADQVEIIERRSWTTWQLVVVLGVGLFVGMMIGYLPKKPGGGGSGGSTVNGHPAVTLPLSGTPTTTTASATRTGSPNATGSSTAAPLTVVSVPPTTSVPTPGGASVDLLPNTNASGPEKLPVVAPTGPWRIGWAYQCVAAPGGSATFRVFVVPTGQTTLGTAAVDEAGRAGSGVSAQTVTGPHFIQVQTDPACRWAVHVTGPAQ